MSDNTKIRVGDIVDVRGVVEHAYSDGDFNVRAVGEEGMGSFAVPGGAVTFLSRPEKTVNVELTKSEIGLIWEFVDKVEWSKFPNTDLFDKLACAYRALNDTP